MNAHVKYGSTISSGMKVMTKDNFFKAGQTSRSQGQNLSYYVKGEVRSIGCLTSQLTIFQSYM